MTLADELALIGFEFRDPVMKVLYLSILSFLILCHWCTAVLYDKVFVSNTEIHEKSPLYPLLRNMNLCIRFIYPLLFISLMFFVVSLVPDPEETEPQIIIYLAAFSGFLTNWFTSAYQIVISTISFYKFHYSRQSKENIHKVMTRKDVEILMYSVGALLMMKDIICAFYIYSYVQESDYNGAFTVVVYYAIYYGVQQALVVTGSLFHWYACSIQKPDFSDEIVAIHNVAIVLIKIVFLFAFLLIQMTRFRNNLVPLLFVIIDMFLVPVVVDLTELMVIPKRIKKEE